MIGETFGRYRLESVQRHDPFSSFYGGIDINLNRPVTVQVVRSHHTHHPLFGQRLAEMARAAVQLDHPSLVRLFDFGQSDQHTYVVTESVEGMDLDQMLMALRAEGRLLAIGEAAQLAWSISSGTSHAFRRAGLLPLITPVAIRLKESGGIDNPNFRQPVLLDLGIVRGAVLPPEEMAEEMAAAMVVRQLAAFFYELLTDRPIDSTRPGRHLEAAVDAALRLRPDLPNAAMALLRQTLTPAESPYPPDMIQVFVQTLADLAQAASSEAANNIQTGTHGQNGTATLLPPPPTMHHESLFVPKEIPAKPSPFLDPGQAQDGGDAVPAHEHLEAATPAFDVEVQTPDGELHRIPLTIAGLSLGRAQGNDVILDDGRASRQHAQIDLVGAAVTITDLGSTNGTFLEGMRLPPHAGQPWPLDKQVRIGRHFLRLVESVRGMEANLAGAPPAQIEPDPEIYIDVIDRSVPRAQLLQQMGAAADRDHGFVLFLPEERVAAEPGQTTEVVVVLLNLGSEANEFHIKAEGVPPIWLQGNDWSPVMLAPGEQQAVSVLVTPPRHQQSRAGNYRLALTGTGQRLPAPQATAQVSLQVKLFSEFRCEVAPQRIHVGESVTITVQHQGNGRSTYRMIWWNDENELDFEPKSADLSLASGERGQVAVTVASQNRHWLGGARHLSMQIQVTPQGGEPALYRVEVINRSRTGL